jgi:diguanylate cyclase (GGDEF)-like protein
MATGICVMHYVGMAALELSPGIVWNLTLVAASVGIALVASAAALSIFFWLRSISERHGFAYQAAAAIVMGLAISGMHYTGMAAASFPEGAYCLSVNGLSGNSLGTLVVFASGIVLCMTLATSALDARMQSRTLRLAQSLKVSNAELKSVNEELQRRALTDPLTDLANRALFEDRLAHAVARIGREGHTIAVRSKERLAVLFVDLDGFKPVNDSFGHAAGDAVLIEAARRLRAAARDSDTVARVGGDEFILLVEDAASVADSMSAARRLVDALAQPFQVAGREVRISCSVGIVVYPDQGEPDKLVAHADAAMYSAKRAGGNTCALFESHMDGGALEQLSLQNDLRHAVERGELELHYQPKVEGHRGRVAGVEALLRWRHPQRGMLSPAVFIPIAERFGLINGLGDWVINEACRQLRAWADEGVQMRVAINVSAHQLRQEDLSQRIESALARHRVDASQLLCEITEAVAMEDIKTTQAIFDRLGSIGAFLSIDDFGTGYSSLGYLRQLPARQLKIDRSFINDLETSGDARAVVDAVVRLAHALSLRVVAEGVETEGQRQLLLDLCCDELQGFYFARPMPAAEVLDWVAGQDRLGNDFPATQVDEMLDVIAG